MIFTTLFNIAIFQGIVLGSIILKSPLFKSNANKHLAYSILILSFALLMVVFESIGIYDTLPFLLLIGNMKWDFLFPVFFFLFIVHQVNHPVAHSKKIRYLFIPFLYSTVINLLNDLDVVINLYQIPNAIKPVINIFLLIDFFLVVLFIPFITIYSYKFIKFSADKLERKWITFLWTLVSTLLFSWIFAILFTIFIDWDIVYVTNLLALFATVIIHTTAYLGIFKYRLAENKKGIHDLLNNTPIQIDDSAKEVDLKKSNEVNNLELLTKENPYFNKLEDLCKNHQIYRDATLNRDKVAEKLGISAGYVSQLVNTITGKNFANYINQYRIEAVKEMMLDSEFENYTLLAIGLESGFTSKTTFYNTFKKTTGMTPNAYRNTKK